MVRDNFYRLLVMLDLIKFYLLHIIITLVFNQQMLTRSAIILLIIIQISNKNVFHDEVNADDFPKIKETL